MINNAKVCVGACILRKNNNELEALVLYKPKKKHWEFPGGKIELGETLTQAANREIFEETGLSISVLNLVGLFSYKNKDGNSTIYHKFNANAPTNGFVKLSKEHSEYKWVKARDLEKMKPLSPIIQKWMNKMKWDFNSHPHPIVDCNISDEQ